MDLRVRIHRGAHQIGGNCVELEADGQRIVLDLGLPLDANRATAANLVPDVPGLKGKNDGSFLGVVLSHVHQDHYGLLPFVAPETPVFVGAAAERIVTESAWFLRSPPPFKATGHLRHRRPFVIGPFRITPFLNDHSAFDAYSLLVEAGGRRLFYTGDIRGSGRKAKAFDGLCARPPARIHALLMEGTHVQATGTRHADLTEDGVERELLRLCRSTPGLVAVAYSGQNIDRLVSLYRAAKRAGRELVVDLYGATVARATGNENIPQPGFEALRVLVPKSQAVRIKKEECFERVNSLGRSRIYPEEIAAKPRRFAVTLRGNVMRELEQVKNFAGAQAVWSQWDGYLAGESSQLVREFVDRHSIPLRSIHASGHATVQELQRLVEALSPVKVVPITRRGRRDSRSSSRALSGTPTASGGPCNGGRALLGAGPCPGQDTARDAFTPTSLCGSAR